MGFDFKKFIEPGAEYRGKPFWCWNGKLERDELIRQIHVLKEMGLGGFFAHSRTGLETEYLSDEWFDLTNACAEEAEKLGMEAWLYDEDRWPSGTAGGKVTVDPKYRIKEMHLKMPETLDWDALPEDARVFAARIENRIDLMEYKLITRDTPPSEYQSMKFMVFFVKTSEPSTFFNNSSYADTLSREPTDLFIELTHEQYLKKVGKHFGKSVKGIFTDEPNRGTLMGVEVPAGAPPEGNCPWTGKIPEKFREQFGYDIEPRLPELFLYWQGNPVSQVKWHFAELLQQLFLENWAKPLNEWCEKHGIKLTGHALHEDFLSSQIAVQGSMMRFYEHMGYPGVDVLHERNTKYWIVRQLASAARQTGKKWMLSEMYGVTGWAFPFEGHKSSGDWQAFFGINIRCHHLSWYTMRGESKRDYPASIFHQSAWYKDYHYVETYFARLGYILAIGDRDCDVVVINPVETLWTRYYPGWANFVYPIDNTAKEYENAYSSLFLWLTGAQIDFDYADEEMSSRLYAVTRDPDGSAVLRIGQARYKTAVVSNMQTIRSTTLKILKEFIQAGGKVIFTGEMPSYVDALPSTAAAELAKSAQTVDFTGEAIVGALEALGARRAHIVSVADRKPTTEVFLRLSGDSESKFAMLLNTNRMSGTGPIEITLDGAYDIEILDCATGKNYAHPNASVDPDGTRTVIRTSLERAGEAVYQLHPAGTLSKQLNVLPDLKAGASITLEGDYEYKLSEPNVCLLDLARWRIDGGEWQPEDYILGVDSHIRVKFNVDRRENTMLQPWFTAGTVYPTVCKAEFSYDFTIEEMPDEDIILAMESPQTAEIKINGNPLTYVPSDDFWVDIAFKKLTVPKSSLVKGLNSITVKIDFNYKSNPEAVYLLGNFGVKTEDRSKILIRLPDRLSAGDIATQGLPFFTGGVAYKVNLNKRFDWTQRYVLNFPDFNAAVIKLHSPGCETVYVGWAPFKADVTEMIAKNGYVWVEPVMTRRNTFGSLHRYPINTKKTGPNNLHSEGPKFDLFYTFYPSGLLKQPIVDYCK